MDGTEWEFASNLFPALTLSSSAVSRTIAENFVRELWLLTQSTRALMAH
jgi:hypothetical protein